MSDGSTPLSRLSEMGLTVPPYEPPSEEIFKQFCLSGNRLYISDLAPFVVEGMEIPRLGQDANVKTEDFRLEDLEPEHPLARAVVGARLATLRALSVAAYACGEDLQRIECCVRARLTVRTGPNFDRLGIVSMPVRNIMNTVFQTVPSMSSAGVAALPAGVPMMLETEFALRDE